MTEAVKESGSKSTVTESNGKGKTKKKKAPAMSKGVETLFKSSYRTHIDLSALADGKANMMIGINGIILSAILASLASKLDTNDWLLLPFTAILATCLVSIVFAVLAARPRVPKSNAQLADFKSGKSNLLFFANFTRLSETEFVDEMMDMIEKDKEIYKNMSKDIYGLGSVLTRKFALLRNSYTCFMIGIVISTVLFVFMGYTAPKVL